MRKPIKYKLIKPTLMIILLLLLVNIGITYTVKTHQATAELKANAQNIATQMQAVWDYLSVNQDKINHTLAGIYEYKGVHCAIAGTSIADNINRETDNTIRFVREKPRNTGNAADIFELEALRAFQENPQLTNYYDLSTKRSKQVFRYVEPMYVDTSCLECHGEPAGEMDPSGYYKDGLQKGDLIGATSVLIPTADYTQKLLLDIIQEALIFLALMAVCVLVIYFFVNKFVTKPISELEQATKDIGQGYYDVELASLNNDDEIESLAKHIEQMSANLKVLHDNLEDQVEMRTEQLAQANLYLEQQQELLQQVNLRLNEENEYKSDFLAIMSHELRTPLSSIITFTEILINDNLLSNPQDVEVLKEIRLSSDLLLNLINNILEMAKIEAGKVQLADDIVDWLEISGYIKTVINPLAQQKNIEFSTTVNPHIPLMCGDWDKLRRMVENVTGNAVKFTPEGGKIALNIDYNATRNLVIIRVADNGIGIAAEDAPYIFEKFVQGDSSNKRTAGGTGLGLALSKNIAEMHGGHITFESALDQGSIFTIEIPLVLPPQTKLTKEENDDENHVG